MRQDPKLGKPVTVFILDSNGLECQLMVRALQESHQPIRVVGCATESAEILRDLKGNPNLPDVAIISADLKEGPATGLQVVREARVSYPHTRIIVLVDFPERSMVVEGFRAGADGVFSRDEPFEMLCKCIHAVCAGQIWAGSDKLRFLTEALAKGDPQPIKGANGTRLLTKREEDLIQLVAEGLPNRDIAHQLNLTEHTVRNYLFRIFNKLGTSNRLELALYVIKQRGVSQSTNFDTVSLAVPAPATSVRPSPHETGSLTLRSED
jgi:DNA-binding NarL/FixJ family response regulator